MQLDVSGVVLKVVEETVMKCMEYVFSFQFNQRCEAIVECVCCVLSPCLCSVVDKEQQLQVYCVCILDLDPQLYSNRVDPDEPP